MTITEEETTQNSGITAITIKETDPATTTVIIITGDGITRIITIAIGDITITKATITIEGSFKVILCLKSRTRFY